MSRTHVCVSTYSMELLEYVKRVLESVTIHTADVTRVSGTAAVDRADRRLEWRRHSATRRSRTMAAAGYELRGVYGTEPYWPEKKLKICVTGAGGFIGSHLAKRLKEEGHHVVACDWKRNEHMEVRSRLARVKTSHR